MEFFNKIQNTLSSIYKKVLYKLDFDEYEIKAIANLIHNLSNDEIRHMSLEAKICLNALFKILLILEKA